MVARALFLLAEFDRSSVQSIVTLATPHQHPPIATLDWNMASFYDRVNDYWSKKLLDELFFHSIGGGVDDTFVRQLSTRLDKVGLHLIINDSINCYSSDFHFKVIIFSVVFLVFF